MLLHYNRMKVLVDRQDSLRLKGRGEEHEIPEANFGLFLEYFCNFLSSPTQPQFSSYISSLLIEILTKACKIIHFNPIFAPLKNSEYHQSYLSQ